MEMQIDYSDKRLEVNDAYHIVRVDGEVKHLTPIEYRILLMLVKAPGRLVRFAELTAAWADPNTDVWADHIKYHMRNLRKKLGGMVESVRGFGYRYAPWIVEHGDRHGEYWLNQQGSEAHKLEDAANARLMAAAPELLEALSDIIRGIDQKGERLAFHLANKARAAIAKAKGGVPTNL